MGANPTSRAHKLLDRSSMLNKFCPYLLRNVKTITPHIRYLTTIEYLYCKKKTERRVASGGNREASPVRDAHTAKIKGNRNYPAIHQNLVIQKQTATTLPPIASPLAVERLHSLPSSCACGSLAAMPPPPINRRLRRRRRPSTSIPRPLTLLPLNHLSVVHAAYSVVHIVADPLATVRQQRVNVRRRRLCSIHRIIHPSNGLRLITGILFSSTVKY